MNKKLIVFLLVAILMAQESFQQFSYSGNKVVFNLMITITVYSSLN